MNGKLPKIYQQSQHYRHASRTDNDDLDTWLLILMESVFMVLLQTVKYPGYTTRFNPKELYDSLERLTQILQIESPLFVLNMSLSVFQAMPHPWSQLDLSCVSCQDMTYPSHHLQKKTSRRPFDSKDPSKGYLCEPCRGFRRQKKRLPTNEEILQACRLSAHLKEEASHQSCEICNDVFSEIVTNSDGSIHRRHVDGKWCCHPCYNFYNSHKRFPTPNEIHERKNRRTAKDATSCGECGCDITESQYRRFQDGKWCCDYCGKFFRYHQRFPTREEREEHDINSAMRLVKACQCYHIPFTEIKGRRFVIDKKKCCADCKNFHKIHKRLQNNDEVKNRQKEHRSKQSTLKFA